MSDVVENYPALTGFAGIQFPAAVQEAYDQLFARVSAAGGQGGIDLLTDVRRLADAQQVWVSRWWLDVCPDSHKAKCFFGYVAWFSEKERRLGQPMTNGTVRCIACNCWANAQPGQDHTANH